MKSRTSKWFETSVAYERQAEQGLRKKVTELYVVEALSFGEAEVMITQEMSSYVSGEFEVKNIMLNDQTMLLTLGLFDSEQEAKDYITAMMLSDYLFGGIDKDSFSVLPISVSNYAVFYKEKDLVVYKGFLNGDDPNVVMAPKTLPENAEKKGGGELKGGEIKGGGDARKGEEKKGGGEQKGGTSLKPDMGTPKTGTTLKLDPPKNGGNNNNNKLNNGVKKRINDILKKG